MTDDWSLKEKQKIIDTKFYEVNPARGATTVNAYLAEDIEILRKKLIRDLIKELEWKELGKSSIKRIINKRFGAEE